MTEEFDLSKKVRKQICGCGLTILKPCMVCDNTFVLNKGVVYEEDIKEFIRLLKKKLNDAMLEQLEESIDSDGIINILTGERFKE